MTKEQKGLVEIIKDEVKTAYKMVYLMQPKTEEEFIAVVVPNLHLKVFDLLSQETERARKEERERIMKSINDLNDKMHLGLNPLPTIQQTIIVELLQILKEE